jgi:phosphonate transport system substrate-binding protein
MGQGRGGEIERGLDGADRRARIASPDEQAIDRKAGRIAQGFETGGGIGEVHDAMKARDWDVVNYISGIIEIMGFTILRRHTCPQGLGSPILARTNGSNEPMGRLMQATGQKAGLDRRRVLAAAAALVASPDLARAEAPVTFGLTPVFLDSDLQLIGQIEAYLSERIARRVQLVKRRTYQEITSLLVAGQIDAAWICGYPFVRNREALRLLAVPLYRGAPLYRSYLIERPNRASRDIRDLKGDIHAFSDPDSNSGFLVTRALLADAGERHEAFFRRTFFTYGHRNVIRAVAAGLAQSGSVDGYVWDVMREIEPNLIAQTRIVAQSEPMGFPPVAASAATRPDVAQAIASALVEIDRSAIGRTILATLRLDGFTAPEPLLFDGIMDLSRRARIDG